MLGFLLGTLVVLAIISLMIASPAFRKAALILLGLVALGVFYLVQQGTKEAQERERQQLAQEQRATTSIRPDEISLTEVALTKEQFGSWWVLTGTVTNNSKFDLASIQFSITMKDCVTSQNCRTVGQETTSTRNDDSWRTKLLVPSGQVRLFSTRGMDFKGMPPVTNLRWEYKVTKIRASF